MSDALIEVLAADDSGYSNHGQLCPCARGTSKENPKPRRSILHCNCWRLPYWRRIAQRVADRGEKP